MILNNDYGILIPFFSVHELEWVMFTPTVLRVFFFFINQKINEKNYRCHCINLSSEFIILLC